MNSDILIRDLSGIPIDQIFETFTEAFSDYLVPLRLTANQFHFKLKSEDFDPSISVGAFENGRLIAFVLNGIREENGMITVYNGGTGVVPTHRRKGLADRMYEFNYPLFKQNSVGNLTLEVLKENTPAIAAYKKQGYAIKRELVCLSGKLTNLNSKSIQQIEVKESGIFNPTDFESMNDVICSWQNAYKSFSKADHALKILTAFCHGQMSGYLIYNQTTNRIYQIAVNKKLRRKGIGSALLIHLHKGSIHTNVSITNIDSAANSAILFFKNAGLKNQVVQYEMTKQLNV